MKLSTQYEACTIYVQLRRLTTDVYLNGKRWPPSPLLS